MWIPQLVCPDCRGHLDVAPIGLPARCPHCCRSVEQRDGVLRFLDQTDAIRQRVFAAQYRAVREGDGYRRADAAYYRTLPSVSPDDPRAFEWRVRCSSYASLRRHALAVSPPALRIADLGAGCGWLAHRLTLLGHDVVAVDRLDDEIDGLGVGRHYPVEFARAQADFDALPFADGQFDMVVFNASLHYSSDPGRSLGEARRLLAPRGALAVVDSPMFDREPDGQRMVADQLTRFAEACGVAAPVRQGVGFLTYRELDHTAARLGLAPAFFPSRGPLSWRLRRAIARVRLGRAPAAFGVWVAR